MCTSEPVNVHIAMSVLIDLAVIDIMAFRQATDINYWISIVTYPLSRPHLVTTNPLPRR